ncbi:MAG: hypothetical protein AB1630_08435 [bacterium]
MDYGIFAWATIYTIGKIEMNAITYFLFEWSPFFLLLSILLLFFFFILPFVVAIDFSRGKKWKIKLPYLLIALLFDLSITLIKLIPKSRFTYDILSILFISVFNILFFLFIRRAKRLKIAIWLLFFNLLIIFALDGAKKVATLCSCGDRFSVLAHTIKEKGDYAMAFEKYKSYKCPITGVPYEWARNPASADLDSNFDFMLFWEGKPHGIVFKWRRVAFMHGGQEVKLVPEQEFQKLLKEQQGETKQK